MKGQLLVIGIKQLVRLLQQASEPGLGSTGQKRQQGRQILCARMFERQ